MNRRAFFGLPFVGLVGVNVPVISSAAIPVKKPVTRVASNFKWFVTPPGPSYSDPLYQGRKMGLRWTDEQGDYWGVVALLYMVHDVIPRPVLDVARDRLMRVAKDWEKGSGDTAKLAHDLVKSNPYKMWVFDNRTKEWSFG